MAIDDDISFLESVPMLRTLGRAALRIVAIGAESHYVHGNEKLFENGELADSGYLVQEGSFRLSAAEAGAESTVGRGTLLGEFALMTETTRGFTATATEPSTVIRIPRSLFLKTLEGYPDAARRLRDYIATRTDHSVSDMRRVRAALDRDRDRGT